jgi:ribosomal protein S18 acetylase RimI-like enzyme
MTECSADCELQWTMAIIQPPFRRATINDAGTLAQFVEFASEGLAVYLWTKIAGGSPDPWHIGRERVTSETGGLSYRNAIVTELAGQPISGLISYPLGDKTEQISDRLPAVLVPLHELMNLALDSWYIHVVAVAPEFRGKGQGLALLALAERLAGSAGKPSVSLIVSDTNSAARRLYEGWGYREIAQRQMVKEQWQHPGVNWLLLRKQL